MNSSIRDQGPLTPRINRLLDSPVIASPAPVMNLVKKTELLGVQMLDSILSGIVTSLDKNEHREFLSMLNVLQNTPGALAFLTTADHTSPMTSIASSPLERCSIPQMLVPSSSIQKSTDSMPFEGLFRSSESFSADHKMVPPPVRLPPILSLLPALPPVSSEKESKEGSSSKSPPRCILGPHTEDLLVIRKRKFSAGVKHYIDPQPSKYCHICKLS